MNRTEILALIDQAYWEGWHAYSDRRSPASTEAKARREALEMLAPIDLEVGQTWLIKIPSERTRLCSGTINDLSSRHVQFNTPDSAYALEDVEFITLVEVTE